MPQHVQPPALNRTERVHRAGHSVSCGYIHNGLAACVDECEVRPHLIEAVAPVLGVPVAELSRLVSSPALDPRSTDERADVVLPCIYGLDRIVVGVRDGHRVAHLPGAVALVRGGPYSQLAMAVVAPAGHIAVVEYGACEVVPSGYLDRRPPCREVNGRHAGAHLSRVVPYVGGALDAQLALRVVAPAEHLPVGEQSAGMVPAHGQGDRRGGGERGGYRGDGGVIADFVRGVAHEGGIADSKLSLAVVSPAGDFSIVQDCAGVAVTGLYFDNGPARGQREIRQHFARLLVAVPESVDIVVPYSEQRGLAPAFYRPVLEECAGMALTERGLRDVEAVARVDER